MCYLIIWRIDEREGGLFLQQEPVRLLREMRKMSAYHDVIAVVGSFFPRLFQVGFEFFDGLVEGSIVAKTFRLEQTLRPETHMRRV